MKKRKTFGKILLYILLFVVVALLVILPFVFEDAGNNAKDNASILSIAAEKKRIEKVVSGTGILTDEDAVDVELPYGVEITKYLVSNNDFVTEGTPLAEVDRIGVMNAIYEYQEDMEYLESLMMQYTDTGALNFITTSSAGRVMEIYANVGDSISDVMLEHGALAVISLDGLLAVDAEGLEAYSVGSTLGVVSSAGNIVAGHIESRKNGISTITLSQEGQISGDNVNILDENYSVISSGTLYVHSPLRISGYSGTVDAVHVKINQDLAAGATVFTYAGNPGSAEYGVYAARHRELEELIEKLFKMYNNGTVNAPCSGVVTGIDEDAAAKLMSARDNQGKLTSLINKTYLKGQSVLINVDEKAPVYPYVYYEAGKINYVVINHDAADTPNNSWIDISRTDVKYRDRLQAINAVSSAEWNDSLSFEQLQNYGVDTLSINEQNVDKIIFVFEYLCQSESTYTLNSISTEISGVTVWASTTASTVMGNTYSALNTSKLSKPQLVLLGDESEIYNGIGYSKAIITGISIGADRDSSTITFALDNNCYSSEAKAKELYGTDNYLLTESFSYFEPWIPVNQLSESSIGLELIFTFNVSGGIRQAGAASITSSLAGSSYTDPKSGGASGGSILSENSAYSSGGSSTQSSHEYYSTKTSKPFSIVPQDNMTVDITVDELDILSIEKGQSAVITLDALLGQSFDGVITDIGVSGSNSGGNSKYTAEVTIKRETNMISGMNATANITVSAKELVLSLPTEAISSDGTKSIIYTGYDEKTGNLLNPVEIETGASDGKIVEILSGIQDGQTVWYAYYDKPSVSLDFMMPPDIR